MKIAITDIKLTVEYFHVRFGTKTPTFEQSKYATSQNYAKSELLTTVDF